MLGRLARHLSYANVMATVAFFLALAGGAYAAIHLPPNSVGRRALRDGAVSNRKLANHAVTGAKVAVGSLTGRQIKAATLGTVPTAGHATTADNAAHATAADSATRAGTADNATHAGTADNATHAGTADNATHAGTADSATRAVTADNGVFAFGQVREDGTVKDASDELVSVTHTAGTGLYCLAFRDPPAFIALEGSTVSDAGSPTTPIVVPRVTNGQGADCSSLQLAVRITDTSGTATDGRFSFQVP